MSEITNADKNKAIARLIGYSYHPHNGDHPVPGWHNGKVKVYYAKMPQGAGTPYLGRTERDLRFDRDWNWVMFAVHLTEKRYDVAFIMVSGTDQKGKFYTTVIEEQVINPFVITDTYVDVDDPNRLQSVYEALYQFSLHPKAHEPKPSAESRPQ
jgi:hypothetical protein